MTTSRYNSKIGHTEEVIIQNLRTRHPDNVTELARIVLSQGDIDERDFVDAVKDLAKRGVIILRESYTVESFLDYMSTIELSAWFWFVVTGLGVGTISVFYTPNVFPFVLLRWVFGSILVLYIPGFVLLQFLFPKPNHRGLLESTSLSVRHKSRDYSAHWVDSEFSSMGNRNLVVRKFGSFSILSTWHRWLFT